jgi:ABC-2 type transport system permease protein/sodium transport system permease protein
MENDRLTLADKIEPSDNLKSKPHFRWRQQWEFIRKELRETLRDRRTIITLLAMPILLYPLLGLGFRFLAVQQLSMADTKIYVGLETEDDAKWISESVALASTLKDDSAKNEETASQATADTAKPEIVLSLPRSGDAVDLKKMVADGLIDVGVRISRANPSLPTAIQNPSAVELIYNSELLRSRNAADYLEQKFNTANGELIRLWAESQRIRFQIPIQQQRTRVKGTDRGPAVLGLLPLVLLLMTVTGGVYPSIDLTAGERERNTLETLMALPVPKIRLLLAKFVAVVSVTMLTGMMNLIAMAITLYALQLDTILLGPSGFSLVLAIKLFLILSTFALFYSALLLVLTSSARSFKEAQAYLIPLLLLSITPGLVILLPGWRLGQGTAVIPLVNILLLSKEVLEGAAPLLPAILALLSTVLYGAAALSLAAQIFGADAVAVGSRSRWRDLLQRPMETRPFPNLSLVLFGLAVLFPAYFIASGILSRVGEMSPIYRLGLSGFLTVLLFLLWPLALLRWQNVIVQSAMAVNRASVAFMVGGILIGLSAWPFVYEIVLLGQSLGLGGLDLSRFEQVKALLASWSEIPLPIVLLALAVAPGVCEEAFFRGFLFGGIRRNLNAAATIIATALAFALFHVVLAGGAAPERLLPSFLMGLVLGWVRHRSASVIPGILLHVLHNASLLTIAHFREELEGWGIGAQHQTHLPLTWIGLAALVLVVGLVCVAAGKVNREIQLTKPDKT